MRRTPVRSTAARFVATIALGLGLSLARPAEAYRIRAALEKEPGNSFSGPVKLSTEFENPSNEVQVDLSEGFPDNSEVIGFARVRLADGSMRGDAHAVTKVVGTQHSLRFVAVLEESIEITFPPGLPPAERFVTVHADVTAGAVANGIARAHGIFSILAQSSNLRGAVQFGSDVPAPGWRIIDEGLCVDGGACVTSSVGDGGAHFAIRVAPNRSGEVYIECQFEGTAEAFTKTSPTPQTGIADVFGGNSAHLSLELPPGTTFTSTSGIFLTEQGTPGGQQRPADANQDGKVDLSDTIWLLGFLFQGTISELPCDGGAAGAPHPGALALLDSNGDTRIDISDAVYVLTFLFQGGNDPVLGKDCVPIAGCPDRCGQ